MSGSVRINWKADWTRTTVPSSPARGPRSTRTRCPSEGFDQGPQSNPEAITVWIERISSSGMAVGTLPTPAIDNTPGTRRTESLCRTLSLQNVYPVNKGASKVFVWSGHKGRDLYKGRYP